jgi:hypothetical protein
MCAVFSEMPRHAPKGECCYSTQWEQTTIFPQYAKWISPVHGQPHYASCRICHSSKPICLSNMGTTALDSHARGNKHLELIKMANSVSRQGIRDHIRQELQSATVTATIDSALSKSTPAAASQATSDTFVVKRSVAKAEILWALKVVTAHMSMNSSSDIVDLFQRMFPDSETAICMRLGPDKLTYMVNHGLAPFFAHRLLTIVRPKLFVSAFDEAFNKIVNRSQMDVHVIYFDGVEKQVIRRYLGSTFLGHSAHSDLLKAFTLVHEGLDYKRNLVQVSMDGPNVNWKLLEVLQAHL